MNPQQADNSKMHASQRYQKIKPIENGAFGMVYQAKDLVTNEIVALKKVFQDKRYINRELQILKELDHPNSVKLYNHYLESAGDNPDEQYLNLIMDWMPRNLHKALKAFTKVKQPMPLIHIKLYAYQLLRTLAYTHSIGICHRDIKPANIIVDPETIELKLCDFGSAKKLVKGEPNVSYISSRCYRAPELIFGATEYTPAIDLWSTGCVIAELVLEQPIFAGSSSIDQIVEIIKVLGTPNKQQIQAMNPLYTEYRFPVIKQLGWEKVFKNKNMPNEFFDLIDKILTYDPSKRIKPLYLLNHPFFDELKQKSTRLEDGKPLPELFNFNEQEMSINQSFIRENLIPSWYSNNNS